MYFIWGEDQYIIDFNKKKIVEKIGIMPIIFNESSNLLDIIAEIKTISLFAKNKVIIIDNLNLLTTKDSINTEELFKIIKQIPNDITIIFTLNKPRLLLSNPLVKFLLKNSTIIKAEKLKEKDVISIIKNIISAKNGKITNKAALKLAIMLPNNLLIINSEIDKLLLEKNEISEKMVNTSVVHYDKDDVFALSNAIISGNASEIIESYYEKINNGVDPIMIIAQLASNYELAYLIFLYKKLNYSIEQISTFISIHTYRLKMVEKILDHEYSYPITKIIKWLSNLDYDIKIGKMRKLQGLDKFILNLIKN